MNINELPPPPGWTPSSSAPGPGRSRVESLPPPPESSMTTSIARFIADGFTPTTPEAQDTIRGHLGRLAGRGVKSAADWVDKGAQILTDRTLKATGSPFLAGVAGMVPDVPLMFVPLGPAADAAMTGGRAAWAAGKVLMDRATGKTLQRAILGKVANATQVTKDLSTAKDAVRAKLGAEAAVANSRYAQGLTDISSHAAAPEDVGLHIQNTGAEHVKKLKSTLATKAEEEIAAIYNKGTTREAAGKFVSNHPTASKHLEEALKKAEASIIDSPNTPEHKAIMLKALKGMTGNERAMTTAEQRVENLRASVAGREAAGTVSEPLTFKQWHGMERWAKEAFVRDSQGFKALNDANLKDMATSLKSALTEYEPRFGEWLSKYREGKSGIEASIGGKPSVISEAASIDGQSIFPMKPQSVVSHYLDGTRTGAEKLVNLVGDKSKVAPQVAGYLRHEVAGMTSKQAGEFLTKNQGLLQTFPELKTPLERIVAQKTDLETVGSKLGKAQERYLKSVGNGQFAHDVTKIEGMGDAVEIASAARGMADKLLQQNLIDSPRYKSLIDMIDHTAKSGADIKVIRRSVLFLLGATAAYEVLPKGGHYIIAHTVGRITGGH